MLFFGSQTTILLDKETKHNSSSSNFRDIVLCVSMTVELKTNTL